MSVNVQYPNNQMDIEGWHVDKQKRLDLMKANFSQFATKIDFLSKRDGYQYVLGCFGKSQDDLEWRIWKSLRDISKADEYLYEGTDENEAKAMFKSIINEDVVNKKLEKDEVEKSIKKGGYGSGRKQLPGRQEDNEIALEAQNHEQLQELLEWFEKRFPDAGPDEALRFINAVKKSGETDLEKAKKMAYKRQTPVKVSPSDTSKYEDQLEGSDDKEASDNADKKGLLAKQKSEKKNLEIEKGKKAAIGEIRDWGGVKYRKTSDGWAKVGKEPSPEERAEQEELAAKDIADDENISIKNEIKNKLSNAQDFGEFLEIIDSTGQGTLEDVFVDYGLEYIDTPGDWAMEDNEADPQSAYSDIIEYYEGNVSDEDFTKLVDLWNDIKDDDKLAMLQFKKD